MATQSSQNHAPEGKQMDVFQLESRVSHAKQATEHLQAQQIDLNEELQQTQCKMECEQETAEKIAAEFKEVQGELRKEKKRIANIQEKSKETEGTKRGNHVEVVAKKKDNNFEIHCQRKILRQEETAFLQAQHDQLCAQAQLENINQKLEMTQRVVDQLGDRLEVLRKVVAQKQCKDQQTKAKMVLLTEDLQNLSVEEDQLDLEISKVVQDKATITEAQKEVKNSIARTTQNHENLLSEISQRTKELNSLISYRQKLEQRSYSLKEEVLKSRRHLEEVKEQEPRCPKCEEDRQRKNSSC